MRKGLTLILFLFVFAIISVGFGVALNTTCTDTDSGLDYFVYGYIYGFNSTGGNNYTQYDSCSGGFLWESYCNGSSPRSLKYNCGNFGPNYFCSNGICVTNQTPSCNDTDGGLNYLVKGTVTDSNFTRTDFCVLELENALKEYYCSSGYIFSTYYNCSSLGTGYTCSNGACVQNCTPQTCSQLGKSCGNWSNGCGGTLNCGTCQNGYSCVSGQCVQNQNPPCTDTDGGLNYYVKGTVIFTLLSYTDSCFNSNLLFEYYCNNNSLGMANYSCPNSCSNGACILTNQTNYTCGNGFCGGGVYATIYENNATSVLLKGFLYNISIAYIGADNVKFYVNGESTNTLTEGSSYLLSNGEMIYVSDIMYYKPSNLTNYARIVLGENAESCSIDCNYICGDANSDGLVNIADAVYLINYIFSGGPAPNPLLAGDADGSGIVNIGDPVYLINYIFGNGSAPCSALKSWNSKTYENWNKNTVNKYLADKQKAASSCSFFTKLFKPSACASARSLNINAQVVSANTETKLSCGVIDKLLGKCSATQNKGVKALISQGYLDKKSTDQKLVVKKGVTIEQKGDDSLFFSQPYGPIGNAVWCGCMAERCSQTCRVYQDNRGAWICAGYCYQERNGGCNSIAYECRFGLAVGS